MKWPPTVRWMPDEARVHLLGIGGAGMSGLAELLAAAGCQVSGCDQESSPALDRLARCGIRVMVGHSPDHAAEAELLVVTSAVRADHPEVSAFVARRIPVVKR
ncbi:MAG: Mur ligase domain-containing protein, partial [Thermomicrobium sp.]|nr:Mur ligase domain-containing protein [Thermomicrobium sp.]